MERLPRGPVSGVFLCATMSRFSRRSRLTGNVVTLWKIGGFVGKKKKRRQTAGRSDRSVVVEEIVGQNFRPQA